LTKRGGVGAFVAVLSLWLLIAAAGCGGEDLESRVQAARDASHTTFVGSDSGDHLAAAVVGDFNGDGRLDMALAATGGDGPDEAREDAGEVVIVTDVTSAESIVDLADSGARTGPTFYGPFAGAALGHALAAGDFNGDSIDDLAMTAPLGVDPATGTESPGIVYVHLGSQKESKDRIDLSVDQMPADIRGAKPGDGAGLTLQSADFDRDRLDDLLIGAHVADGASNQRPESGEAYVVAGSSLTPTMVLPADATTTVLGAATGNHLSEAMGLGDFSGDGTPDLAIAATFAEVDGEEKSGLTYVLESPPAGGVIDLAEAPVLLSVGGAEAGDQLGHAIAGGDWDGDGVSDLWLGAVSADGPENSEDLAGEARLFLIRSGGGNLRAGDETAIVLGPGPLARLGRNAASSQFGGGPELELAIAATDVMDRRGEVYILPANQPPPERADDSPVVYRGHSADDILGHEAFGSPSLSGYDLDGDDISELIVAAPGSDGSGRERTDCGEIYLISPDFIAK